MGAIVHVHSPWKAALSACSSAISLNKLIFPCLLATLPAQRKASAPLPPFSACLFSFKKWSSGLKADFFLAAPFPFLWAPLRFTVSMVRNPCELCSSDFPSPMAGEEVNLRVDIEWDVSWLSNWHYQHLVLSYYNGISKHNKMNGGMNTFSPSLTQERREASHHQYYPIIHPWTQKREKFRGLIVSLCRPWPWYPQWFEGPSLWDQEQ